MIYTIGYENLSAGELAQIAKKLDAIVVDARGSVARTKSGFGRRQLETLLGARYEYRGHELGNRGQNTVTDRGLRALAARQEHVIVMCQEEAPGECHRHHLIGLPLAKRGTQVLHIYQDELIEPRELQRAIDEDDDYECTKLD